MWTRSRAAVLGLRSLLAGVSPCLADLVITGLVFAATALPFLVGRPRVWWAVALVVPASLPLLWRRRAPLTVTLVVGLATTGLALVSALPPLPYGALVCVYTFALLSPPLWRLIAVLGTAAGVVVSFAFPEELIGFGYLGLAYSGAYALGADSRARRAQIEMLEERARRLGEERATAAARERTRIARDMHDIVTHSVGVMVVQAEAGPLAMRDAPERAEAAFDAIAATGRDAIAQLRRVVGTLRAPGDVPPREPAPGIGAVPALVDGAV